MKKDRFSDKFILVLFLLLTCLAPAARAQIRGKALYDKLQAESRKLVPFDGQRTLQWTPDGEAYYLYENKTFNRIDLRTGEKSPLFDDARIIAAYNTLAGKEISELPFRQFSFLDDGITISFVADNKVWLFNQETGKLRSYVPEKQVTGVRGRRYSEVLSPDLTMMAFARDFNLYVRDMEGKETALTTDGHTDLRNAFPDWVYPEELGQYEVFWWSPDSKKIAFMQFDEGPVRQYPIVHDITPVPTYELQRYPKAGENNPIVRLFIVDVKSGDITLVDTGMETNVYIYRGQWTKDGKSFTWQRLNRWQNAVELFAADPETGKSKRLLKDEDPCYVEGGELRFLEDNVHFLWTSERSGWNEIYLYDMTGKLIRQVTDTKLPVRNILAVDESLGLIYFAGQENRGLESSAYRINMDGTGLVKLTEETGSHSVRFGPGAKYYVDSFSSFDHPGRTTLHTADGKQVEVLGESAETEEFKNLNLVKPEHFIFKSADGKHDLDGILYKPAHFDPDEHYPLIMSVYGGPGAKRIYNRYNMNDGNQTLAQLGFIVAAVDHRGVSGRGKAFQNQMYLNLGQIELADHTAAVKQLAERPYIDGSRVGIYGHSYGGYLTCIALLKEPDVFHVGVAGAPVTDWRNYDTIYTERYMRRPQDNPEGYKQGSCMTFAKNLKGHLAIHHGAVDDNVHPGNTIQLIYELLRNDKTFDLMIYPEQQHGIRFRQYAEARIAYFLEHLKPDVK